MNQDAMNEIHLPVDMLKPIEDVGGAAQPLLQVNGLTKHFPVRGDLFSARKTVRVKLGTRPESASSPSTGP